MSLKPVVILVRPQLGANIGKTARAMRNFGLEELRLVAPRDGWPNPDAGPAASGADIVLDNAKVYETVQEACADLTRVFAATVRPRDVRKSVATPEEAADIAHTLAADGLRIGYMFGPERAGLLNEDVSQADTILSIAVNPEFGSLNLAQAVVISAYEWFKRAGLTSTLTDGRFKVTEGDAPASKEEVHQFLNHLEAVLDRKHYFWPEHKRERMEHNLRNIVSSLHLTVQGVRTLHGVVKQLERPDRPKSEEQ